MFGVSIKRRPADCGWRMLMENVDRKVWMEKNVFKKCIKKWHFWDNTKQGIKKCFESSPDQFFVLGFALPRNIIFYSYSLRPAQNSRHNFSKMYDILTYQSSVSELISINSTTRQDHYQCCIFLWRSRGMPWFVLLSKQCLCKLEEYDSLRAVLHEKDLQLCLCNSLTRILPLLQ